MGLDKLSDCTSGRTIEILNELGTENDLGCTTKWIRRASAKSASLHKHIRVQTEQLWSSGVHMGVVAELEKQL